MNRIREKDIKNAMFHELFHGYLLTRSMANEVIICKLQFIESYQRKRNQKRALFSCMYRSGSTERFVGQICANLQPMIITDILLVEMLRLSLGVLPNKNMKRVSNPKLSDLKNVTKLAVAPSRAYFVNGKTPIDQLRLLQANTRK